MDINHLRLGSYGSTYFTCEPKFAVQLLAHEVRPSDPS
jgi:hypothetical protein